MKVARFIAEERTSLP